MSGVDVEAAREQLRGPVHGTLQTIRGMCTDGELHEAIDRKIAEVDGLVYEVVELLGEQ